MLTVEISIADKKKPPTLKLPERCVNCGKPKQVVMPMKLNMGVEKRGQGVLMDFPVPLCAECEKKERRITNVTLLPFFVAGLLVCVVVFVPVWLITPDGTTSQTLGFSLTVGAFVGLIAGIIGGSVVEFVLKLMFAPVYGQLLLKRPLTAFSLFNDSEDVIGLSAKFTDQKKSLKLTFENDEIAREFEKLNLVEKK
ncbi:MAG: hypothetical protein ABI904_18380 [Chloroflexota bacterium]